MSAEDIDKCSYNVEGEMFSFFGDTGHRYKNKYRSLMFNLKDPRNKVRHCIPVLSVAAGTNTVGKEKDVTWILAMCMYIGTLIKGTLITRIL